MWLTASILAWSRGGSPTLSPGTDAGRVCPKALHDAEPTKHTQPFTGERGLGIGIINQKFISKTDFFYKLQYAPRFEVRISVPDVLIASYSIYPSSLKAVSNSFLSFTAPIR